MADNRFLGKERLMKRMLQIPQKVRVAAEDELHNQAGQLVQAIKPRVPKDHGDLADDVEWKPNPRRDKISVIVTEGAHQPKDADKRKARAVENGRPDMAAQPHFFPTYRANKRRIQNAIQRKALAAVRKLWGGTK